MSPHRSSVQDTGRTATATTTHHNEPDGGASHHSPHDDRPDARPRASAAHPVADAGGRRGQRDHWTRRGRRRSHRVGGRDRTGRRRPGAPRLRRRLGPVAGALGRSAPTIRRGGPPFPPPCMGVGGAALLVFTPSSATLDALGWVWPPALLGLLVWITTRIRRQLPRRGGRWMLYPVIAVTALAAIGGGIHTVSQSINQASAETPPGQLIDVGDHQLFLSCTGSGEPTVILEPGLGETSAAWGLIAPTVAEHTRVCVYDRAGRGRSEPSPTPQDGDQIATDLHTLLDRAGITGPLVMAGHSLGGLYVLDYTARYPEQVAGMVLLDATPPNAFTALPDYPAFYDIYRIATGLFPGLARLGVTQLIYSSSHPELPAPAREQARAALSTAGQARSQRDEFAMVPTMMAQAGAVTDSGRPAAVRAHRTRGRPNRLAHPANGPRRAVRQQHPPGRRRRQPPITARQPHRRRHVQPGDHRGRRRRPNRHTPEVNRSRQSTTHLTKHPNGTPEPSEGKRSWNGHGVRGALLSNTGPRSTPGSARASTSSPARSTVCPRTWTSRPSRLTMLIQACSPMSRSAIVVPSAAEPAPTT